MKKLTLIISALALVLGLSQCAKKPNMPTFGYEGITKDITFTTGNGGDGSKVTIDNTVLNELHYKWEANDVIHVFGSQTGDFTDGKYCGELKLVSTPGSQEGTFEGTLNNIPTEIGTSKIRFYYFGGGDKGATIDLSTQNGMIDNEASSLNKKIVATLEKTITSNTEYSGDLEVLFSIVKFDFHQFGSCNLTMRGTKNNAFSIDAKGNVVKTAGTTTTLSGITNASTAYYVAVMPEDVTKFYFYGNNKFGSETPSKTLDANVFYTNNGNSYEIEAGDAAESPSIKTHVCLECAYAVGGIVSSTPTQYCEYGVVYAKASDIADPANLVIDGENCTKFEENSCDVTNEEINYTVELEGLVKGVKYIVKAYAIGENNTPAYGDAMTFVAGDEPVDVPSNWVNGASPKTFSVSAGTSVKFSQGNLQYIGSAETPYWKFAKHQFDYVGGTNGAGQATTDQNVDRDLFGWGTSGWNNNNHFYQPYNTDNTTYDKTKGYGYGPTNGSDYTLPLTGGYANADWGVYNEIKVGETSTNGWRTLTSDEWEYLLARKDGSENLLFGMGMVSCTRGLIILPDGWNWSGLPEGFPTFTSGTSEWVNVYCYSEWSEMESRGAVFLPSAGKREGVTLNSVGESGYYWSVSCSKEDATGCAGYVDIYTNNVNPQYGYYKWAGFSVRLVR